MNTVAIAFLLINAILLLLLPRRWAPLPLLIGACYVTRGQIIELGPLHFSVIRVLIGVGAVRVIMRAEHLTFRLELLDRLMLVWSVWLLFSSLFHIDPSSTIIRSMGEIYDACGIYFLVRVFIQSTDDVERLCCVTAILLLPVALEMIYEKMTVINLFSILGDGSVSPAIREDSVRARGPFAHAILGGTVGAVCLPLIISLWHYRRTIAVIGIGTCLVIVFTSASSGPIISMMAGIAALYMWRYRHRVRFVRWLLVICYIALDLVMKDPAYYIIARIDLTGSSASWHRARLIQSAIEHLSEWWLVGTDYTRHWMPTGVSWSPKHTDITNHYLAMGVMGGLPLMLLFIVILGTGFSCVGRTLRQMPELSLRSRFLFWALGASLFAQAITFISVSYFDQSFVFLYLTLAAIGSFGSALASINATPVNDLPHDALTEATRRCPL